MHEITISGALVNGLFVGVGNGLQILCGRVSLYPYWCRMRFGYIKKVLRRNWFDLRMLGFFSWSNSIITGYGIELFNNSKSVLKRGNSLWVMNNETDLAGFWTWKNPAFTHKGGVVQMRVTNFWFYIEIWQFLFRSTNCTLIILFAMFVVLYKNQEWYSSGAIFSVKHASLKGWWIGLSKHLNWTRNYKMEKLNEFFSESCDLNGEIWYQNEVFTEWEIQ